MFDWIRENLLTIGILLVLAAAVSAIIVSLIRSKRKGRSSCAGGCAHCPMAGKCHQQTAAEKK
jgi:hypothetical protein